MDVMILTLRGNIAVKEFPNRYLILGAVEIPHLSQLLLKGLNPLLSLSKN